MVDTIFAEIDKRRKIIDMMASMHSDIAKKYKCKYLILDIFLVLSSIILLSCVFIDQSILDKMKISTELSRLIIGMSSIIITGISMFSYIFDWKSKEVAHKQAFKTTLELKNMWRQFSMNRETITIETLSDIEEKTSLIMSQFVAIDNAAFNKLKKRHYMKVQISKLISNHPFVPLFFAKLWLMSRDCKKFKKAIIDSETTKTKDMNGDFSHD